jgi:predicted nucleic acid-binding Zn ribbon protein
MKWTKKEIDNTLYLLKSGKTYKEISITNGRSERSIRNKVNEFGEKSSMYKKNGVDIKCLNCEKEFYNKDRDRKFCSRSCSVTFSNKNKKKVKSDCINCGKKTNRIGNKYCSNVCQFSYERKKTYEKIENGDITLYEKNYKNYLIDLHGNKCMECGWDKVNPTTGKVPIQLEHMDGNSENNSLDNLKLLCPNCHSLTPTYGALNKGNGRKNRKR